VLGVGFLADSGLVNLSYDYNFRFRPDIQVKDVAIIYLDLESYNERQITPYELWDRSLHADLINKLKKAGAKAIVFDIVLTSDTNSPAADAKLVQAATNSGNVVVAAWAKQERGGLHAELIETTLDKPFEQLETVVSWGLAGGPMPDDKECVRRHYSIEDLDAPSLAWRAAKVALTNLSVSPFPERWRWMNYYGPPMSLPHYSYWEVLKNLSPSDTSQIFSNKVVFIGKFLYVGMATGMEEDTHRTPYTRWTGLKSPGPEINATAYLNIVRQDWLERTSFLTEFFVVIGLGAVLGFGLSRLRPIPSFSVGMTCSLGMGVIAYVVTWNTHPHVWFPWLVFSVVQVPAAVSWSVLNHTRRLTQEKKTLEQSIALASVGKHIAPAPAGGIPEPARQGPSGERLIEAQAGDTLCVPDHVLVRRIGQGAYGEVHLAQDIIGNYHAVKVIHRRHFQESAPFDREFHGLKRFTPISNAHPGFVQVLHVGKNERNQYFYYVMELADDVIAGRKINVETYVPKNLAGELKRRQRLPLSECLDICIQISDALAYLHEQHLIHRDVKPANIIFVHGRPKLADIGLVTETADEDHTVSFLGTEGYIPPEGPGSPQADIYSLGKVIYQAATGFSVSRFPELPTALMEKADDDDALVQLNSLILIACETDPRKRYETAGELKKALSNLALKLKTL